jgi:hypothetical protein
MISDIETLMREKRQKILSDKLRSQNPDIADDGAGGMGSIDISKGFDIVKSEIFPLISRWDSMNRWKRLQSLLTITAQTPLLRHAEGFSIIGPMLTNIEEVIIDSRVPWTGDVTTISEMSDTESERFMMALVSGDMFAGLAAEGVSRLLMNVSQKDLGDVIQKAMSGFK